MLTTYAQDWGGGDSALADAGLPPMRVVTEKPIDHWETFMSLPEARQECGIYADDSDDDKVIRTVNALVSMVEQFRGVGKPLTKTEFTCYYSDLAGRLLLNRPGPSRMAADYSDVRLTLTRSDSDYEVPAANWFIDASGEWDALVVNDYTELRDANYKRGVKGPVILQYTAEPKRGDPDWLICRQAVADGLSMLYHAKDDDPVSHSAITRAITRKMPNRLPFA